MPRADHPETARRWATDRLIDLWVCYPAGLAEADARALSEGLSLARDDRARAAIVLDPSSVARGSGLLAAADLVLDGPPAPSPLAVHLAASQLGVEDARRIGVLGALPDALEAGHRAGAAAVVGVVGRSSTNVAEAAVTEARHALLRAQPDLIVSADVFGAADAEGWGRRRSLRQLVLLNPGPTVVSDRVHRAVGGPDLCHREPEYGVLAAKIETRLLQVAEAPDGWRAVLLAGSGTAAMEAMVAASTRPGKRLLVVRNGTYGTATWNRPPHGGLGALGARGA
jgi:hypothetical protein